MLIFLYSIAYIEFKTEEIAEKMLEETQGSDVQGRSIMVDFTGAKSQQQQQGGRGGGETPSLLFKNSQINAAHVAGEDENLI